jgi:hypothetical protein
MPLIIGLLLIVGLVYQMFFRYETYPDPKHPDVYVEYDHLTGDAHRLDGKDQSFSDRLLGSGDGSGRQRLEPYAEEPATSDSSWENPAEESAMNTDDRESAYRDNRGNIDYRMIPDDQVLRPRGRIVKNQDYYEEDSVNNEVSTPRRNPYRDREASRRIEPQDYEPEDGQPVTRRRRVVPDIEPIEPRRSARSPEGSSQGSSARHSEVLAPLRRIVESRRNANRERQTNRTATVSSDESVAPAPAPRRWHRDAERTDSLMPLRPPHKAITTLVNPPARIMIASAASSSAPLPINQIRRDTASRPDIEDGHHYAINKIDLDRDGIGERLIQNAARNDGFLDFSIVKGGQEVFSATGKQLIFLNTSHHGWQDIAVSTGRQKIIFRYNRAQSMYEAI